AVEITRVKCTSYACPCYFFVPGVCSLRTQHLKIIKNKLRAKRKNNQNMIIGKIRREKHGEIYDGLN
ncbi:hypothetical protein NGA96_14215, partial [Enterococcus faecalis]|nr:hypothetical protein [Enterococcus faecalis]MEB7810223.1 hypothetical protein [Enterococcus faecalis]